MMIPRIIDIPFKRKSVFLFGPRQVGKSTLVKHLLADMDFLEVNLLKGDILLHSFSGNNSLTNYYLALKLL